MEENRDGEVACGGEIGSKVQCSREKVWRVLARDLGLWILLILSPWAVFIDGSITN